MDGMSHGMVEYGRAIVSPSISWHQISRIVEKMTSNQQEEYSFDNITMQDRRTRANLRILQTITLLTTAQGGLEVSHGVGYVERVLGDELRSSNSQSPQLNKINNQVEWLRKRARLVETSPGPRKAASMQNMEQKHRKKYTSHQWLCGIIHPL